MFRTSKLNAKQFKKLWEGVTRSQNDSFFEFQRCSRIVKQKKMACRCAASAFPLLPSPATSSFVTTLARSPLTRSGENGRGNYLNHTFKCGWNPQSHQPMKMCKSLKKHLPFLYLSYEQIRDQHYPYRLEVHLWNNGHSSLQHKLQHFHLKKKNKFHPCWGAEVPSQHRYTLTTLNCLLVHNWYNLFLFLPPSFSWWKFLLLKLPLFLAQNSSKMNLIVSAFNFLCLT